MIYIGETIDDKYQVIESIGEGGFGKVFKVQDSFENLYALKICTSNIEEDIRRFNREVRITQGINHEYVIKIIDSNLEHNPPYFIMPLAKCSLEQIIPEIKDDFTKTLDVFEQVCKGVKAIHIYETTHRDIKPSNILITYDEKIVVSDLGLARLNERDTTILTRMSEVIATEDYAPPEQFDYGGTRNLDHRGDIYMLGKTLYQMLTGKNPRFLRRELLEPGLWFIVNRATKNNKEERYQSIDEMLDSLYQYRRISDESVNPKLRFPNLLSSATEFSKQGEYQQKTIEELISILNTSFEGKENIDAFDQIPNSLLDILSENVFSDLLNISLEIYYERIKEYIHEYSFAYAETIANRMQFVFLRAKSDQIKKLCVQITLVASVELNRFAAMHTFDRLLLSIKSDNDAYSVSEGLQEEIGRYRVLYDRIPKETLHEALQLVWVDADKMNNSGRQSAD